MDGEDDIGDAGDVAEAAPETGPSSAETLTRDVEEAVGQQLEKKGHPDPYEGLEGRADSHPGGRYEWARDYEKEARANGTTLEKAMADYTGLEAKYRENPVAGLTYLAQRTGQDPHRLAAAWNHAVNGAGANGHAAYMAQQYEHVHATSQVAAFERDPANKHFAAVRNQMARLVQERPDLDRLSRSNPAAALRQAYKLAVQANPRLGIQDTLDRELSRKDAKPAHRKVKR